MVRQDGQELFLSPLVFAALPQWVQRSCVVPQLSLHGLAQALVSGEYYTPQGMLGNAFVELRTILAKSSDRLWR